MRILQGILVHIGLGYTQGLTQWAFLWCRRTNIFFIVELLGDRTQPHFTSHQQVPLGRLRCSDGLRYKNILHVIKVVLRVPCHGSTSNLLLRPLRKFQRELPPVPLLHQELQGVLILCGAQLKGVLQWFIVLVLLNIQFDPWRDFLFLLLHFRGSYLDHALAP